MALQELLHESKYADLLIVDRKDTFSRQSEAVPTNFLKALLHEVQCAVLIVPSAFHTLHNTVLLYDGTPSSVYAIKMFSDILPSLKSGGIEIVTVQEKNQDVIVPDNHLIKELVSRHFSHADFKVLKGSAAETITEYLKGVTNFPMVVLGAYQRSNMSRWLKTSMADVLLKNLEMPLFIAHHK